MNSCALAVAAVRRKRRQSQSAAPAKAAAPSPQREALRAVKELLLTEPRSEAERKTQTELQRASVGVGAATGGLFFFPLQLAGIAFVVPVLVRFYTSGYQHLRRERRFSAEALTAVLLTGGLAGGFFVALNLGAWFLVFVRWLALKTESQARERTVDLFGQRARVAWLVIEGVEVETPTERIHVGDVIAVQAGQLVPLDGVVIEGTASIDQHTLTGESQPSEKGPGDTVFAATVAISGRIRIRVEKAGEATAAAEIARILTDTSDYKTSLVSQADAFNDKMSLPFLLLGAGSFPFVGLSGALGIMQATPGYRMVLYGPISMLSYLQLAAHAGILIKDGRSLELLQKVDTVVFDKTGTLTLDQPQVRTIHACNGFNSDTILAYAAVAETKQTHPIARAILEEAAARGIVVNPSDEVEYDIGYGISVKINAVGIRVGSGRYMELHGIDLPVEIQELQARVHVTGDSLVLVAVDQKLGGAIVLQPAIRAEAQSIVSQFKARGVRLYIMSGDHEGPTRTLAHRLRMDGYFAGVLPAGKASLVKRLQAEGRNVCFVGDGINDAIALKSANVSVSLHGATTIAIDTAQVVLMNGDLGRLPHLFELADEFRSNMQINLMAATIPSAMIIAGALFFGLGFMGSLILYNVSVPFALYNATRPLLAAERRPIE